MIEAVIFAKTTFAGLQNKFAAGTPNIAGAVGLGAAVDFLRGLDFMETARRRRERGAMRRSGWRRECRGAARCWGTGAGEGACVLSPCHALSPLTSEISTLDVGVQLDQEGDLCANRDIIAASR